MRLGRGQESGGLGTWLTCTSFQLVKSRLKSAIENSTIILDKNFSSETRWRLISVVEKSIKNIERGDKI